MTSADEAAAGPEPTPDNPYPGYCAAHAAVAAQYGWPFKPFRFPGCADCDRAPDYDLKFQPHLAAAEKKE